jgi:hypothetical protein
MVPYDNPLQANSGVYYRYGGFSKLDVIFRNNKVPAISRSDGKLVRDLRRPGVAVPPWLTDPFQPMHCRAVREALTPLETTFSNYEALVQRGKGAVYRLVIATENQVFRKFPNRSTAIVFATVCDPTWELSFRAIRTCTTLIPRRISSDS